MTVDPFSDYAERHPASSASFHPPEADGGAARILAAGPLDAETAFDFLDGAMAALDGVPSGSRLVIDLSRVDYLSSAGVGALTRLLSASDARLVAMSLEGLSPSCRDVLSVLGLLRYFGAAEPGTNPGSG